MRNVYAGNLLPTDDGPSITCHEGTDGRWSFSSTHTTTWALGKGGWSTPRTGRFTSGKDPLCRKLAGPRGRSGRVRKNSPPLGFEPGIVYRRQTLDYVG
jgi:hypothetical protein